MNYKQQQKKDKELLNGLLNDFNKKEIAKIVIRERKRKNKYLNELRETQMRLSDLSEENDSLKKDLDITTEQMNKALSFLVSAESSNKILAKEIVSIELRLLKAFISHMPKVYRKRNQNWTIVQEFLQYYTSEQGSKSSIRKCLRLGIDPYGYDVESKKVLND